MAGSVNNEPMSYEEAINDINKKDWKKAMQSEYESLLENETWILTDLPKGRKPIKSQWIYKIKRDPEGNTRFKARLVAKGYNQRQGFDYKETFAPVVRYDSVRSIVALAAYRDMEMVHFDVKTAFLYGEIDFDNYMEQPEGYKDGTNRVCYLQRSLYGLKQSPRQWNLKLKTFLENHGFRQSKGEPCVYKSKESDSILAIYVDDGLLVPNSIEKLNEILDDLRQVFAITVSNANQFVDLQIERNREAGEIFIHQKDYLEKILDKYKMTTTWTIGTPGDPHTKLSNDSECTQDRKGEKLQFQYREAVGSLMFAAMVSRPDIVFSVSKVSQFMENPTLTHWNGVKRIFQYLNNVTNMGIKYEKANQKTHALVLSDFCDADFAGDVDSRRSTSGYVFMLNGSPITWMTKKQRIVAQSTTEAEYVALAEATKEALWLRQLLTDLGFPQENPTEIYCDNQSAIRLVKNPEYHRRTKHIDVGFHFIRDSEVNGDIIIKFVSSKDQVADIFTKNLFSPAHNNCVRSLNMKEL